jgi:hypothetical protein
MRDRREVIVVPSSGPGLLPFKDERHKPNTVGQQVAVGTNSCAVVGPWSAALALIVVSSSGPGLLPLKDEGPKPKTVGQQVAIGSDRMEEKGLGSDIQDSDQTSEHQYFGGAA